MVFLASHRSHRELHGERVGADASAGDGHAPQTFPPHQKELEGSDLSGSAPGAVRARRHGPRLHQERPAVLP